MLRHIEDENGVLYHWNKIPAPKDAIDYYHLSANASFKDVIMSIRADQACHRETNHFFAQVNPNFDIDQEKVVIFNGENEKEIEKKGE